jgi:pimeloyl-ACP methyl ester carboxylesterase
VQGGQDLMVPASHGPWLASRLPDATPWFDAEAGHLSPLLDIGPVHDWLLERWDNWPHPPPKAPLTR